MDPNQAFLLSLTGFSDLWHCLFSNHYPEVFLQNVLGLTDADAAALPRYLMIWAAVYLLCGAVATVLRNRAGQKSLSSPARMVNNMILTMADFFFIPQLFVFWAMGRSSLAEVVPWARTSADLVRWLSDAWTALFTPLFLFLVVLATVLMPIQAAVRYLKVYKLRGLPHMIFDVGMGLFLLSLALLSMCTGHRQWYLAALPAAIMLLLIQRGGYIPEEAGRRGSGGQNG